MDVGTIVVLFAGSMLAGFVDALIGGGGLILIPLLLLAVPTLPDTSAIATNKVASVGGTTSAAIAMLRRIRVDRQLLAIAVPLALVSAAGGAMLSALMSKDLLRPIIIVLLLAVGIFVALRPQFGAELAGTRSIGRGRWVLALLVLGTISLYDGFFGPGTGMFLIITLTSLLSHSFLESAAMAKVINSSTNIGALLVFALGGHVLWALGCALAVANVIGAQLGARMVINRGTGLVRVALLVLVVVMAGKLTLDLVLDL